MKEPGIISRFVSASSAYLTATYRWAKLSSQEKAIEAGASVLSTIPFLTAIVFMLLFFSVSAAFALGHLFRSFSLGFAAVGSVYALVALILAFLKAPVHLRFQKMLLRSQNIPFAEPDSLRSAVREAETAMQERAQDFQEQAEAMRQQMEALESELSVLRGSGPEQTTSAGKQVLTSTIDLLLNAFVLKNAGAVGKAVVPVVTRAIVHSAVLEKIKNTSLLKRIKSFSGKLFR